ncbi:MAG: prolyl oligopeptidase family serine peptidase [Alteromonadaceae bacterium]|nr:prolyl oligopeptidase family serine peptidase [Alteromonadaceae bacterium]
MKTILTFTAIFLTVASFAGAQDNNLKSNNVLKKNQVTYPYPDEDKDQIKITDKKQLHKKHRQKKKKTKKPAVEKKWMKAMQKGTFEGLPYRLVKAFDYDPKKKYPLILCLHGMGGRGSDNISQLKNYVMPFSQDDLRQAYPHFFVAPQTSTVWSNPLDKGKTLTLKEMEKTLVPDDRNMATFKKVYLDNPEGELMKALRLVDDLVKQYNIDTSRIYVIGHSMGGFGTFNAIWNRPDFFAAAIPSAGVLLPQFNREKIKDIPLWLFHGDDDKIINYRWGVNVFNEMKQLGANMKFTSIKDIGHNAGSVAFSYTGDRKDASTQYASDKSDKTENSLEWLFKQKR